MKSRTVSGEFRGEEIRAKLTATELLSDYMVPGSPQWWELDPGSVEIVELWILSQKIDLAKLEEHFPELTEEIREGVEEWSAEW